MKLSIIKKKSVIFLALFFLSPLWADGWDDASKGFKLAGKFVNLLSDVNNLRYEYSIVSTELDQMNAYQGQYYANKQDQWNRWNGLVSLITPEQKKKVLELNTMSDKDLANIWLSIRKSTENFPAEWLMPIKYDSLANYLYSYWTTEANIDYYIDYIKTLDLSMIKALWKNTNINRKEEIIKLLKIKRKNYSFENIEEFRLYIYFVICKTDDGIILHEWEDYLKKRIHVLQEIVLDHRKKQELGNLIKKQEVLENAKPIEYINSLKSHEMSERKYLWEKTSKERKLNIVKLLKERRKNYMIDSPEEFELYRNFVIYFWSEGNGLSWNEYQREKGKAFASKDK